MSTALCSLSYYYNIDIAFNNYSFNTHTEKKVFEKLPYF